MKKKNVTSYQLALNWDKFYKQFKTEGKDDNATQVPVGHGQHGPFFSQVFSGPWPRRSTKQGVFGVFIISMFQNRIRKIKKKHQQIFCASSHGKSKPFLGRPCDQRWSLGVPLGACGHDLQGGLQGQEPPHHRSCVPEK